MFAMRLRYLNSANTSDRLQHATRALPEMARAAEDALEAYRYLSQFHFSRHLRALERGEMPDNNVGLSTLNGTQQNMLSWPSSRRLRRCRAPLRAVTALTRGRSPRRPPPPRRPPAEKRHA